ncbi:LysR family transcriptional regulator [Kushneria phosphatilytica]|uniref:LysR family transcriptional regulator n=1 Tax=Kushneria phosphatilytica TaxID=657387 RepID=UPI0008DA21E5|nr:LysR family transcriptional regulator [Kushneria phosphatilytica]OHV12758.1 hypothetical protein BH688_01510 [Kushneria phosphatilytica]
MFDFKELEAFVWIVRLGSFRRAAAHLHLTQPSISERISRLEALLGEPMLERGQRPIKPTSHGRIFLRHAEKLLADRQTAVAMLHKPSAFSGTLRLGVVESVAHSWLPDLLNEIAHRFPEMTLELEVDSSPGLAARLTAHDLDMAFLMGPVTAEHVLNRYLCSYAMGMVTAPGTDLSTEHFTLEALRGHAVITFARNSRPYHELSSLLRQHGLDSVKLHCSSSLSTVVRMTLDGLGIGAIPPRLVEQEILEGALINLPCHLPELDFTASWQQDMERTLAESLTSLAIDIARCDQLEHPLGTGMKPHSMKK